MDIISRLFEVSGVNCPFKFQEAERRAALGLPPLGEEEDLFHDPFKTPGAESVEGEQEAEEKDKISWSYSNYMAALEKEELLNNTDETSFSSLLTANTGNGNTDETSFSSLLTANTGNSNTDETSFSSLLTANTGNSNTDETSFS